MKSTFKTIVCKRLLQLRKIHGYTQQEVAKKLQISQNAYSELESGKRKMDIDRLRQLAGLYDVTMNYLVEEQPFQ